VATLAGQRRNVGGTTSQQMHPRPALSRRLGTALGLGDAQALSAAATLTAEWNRSYEIVKIQHRVLSASLPQGVRLLPEKACGS